MENEKTQSQTKKKRKPRRSPQTNSSAIQKIRSELNLEKWSIWMPAQSRLKRDEIVRERETTLPDGSKEKARVVVQRVGKQSLFTTEDQKTYYALIKLWEENGRNSDEVELSIRQLASILQKGWGSKVLKSLTESLLRLRTIPFIWENSYKNATTGETEEMLTAFNILAELKIRHTKKGSQVKTAQGYFKFNEYILNNLRANYTKPLYLDVILQFKSEIAQLLYTYLDLIMAKKTRYERRSEGLFNDLGLEGKSYRNPSDRKRKLVKALGELEGVRLSSGILTRARLEAAKDGKDFKVVFEKVADRPQPERELKDEPEVLSRQPESHSGAEELVRYFHSCLARPDHQPSPKELDQAAKLLTAHGETLARDLVTYALQEAEKTNFRMRTFGAIFQYKDDALREYERVRDTHERHHAEQEQLQELVKASEQETQHQQTELDNFYTSLSAEQQAEVASLIEQRLREKNLSGALSSSLFHEPVVRAMKYTVLREMATRDM